MTPRLRSAMPTLAFGVMLCTPALAAPVASESPLAPHRAIYELKLSQSRGSGGLGQVRGRIVYEFKGDACDGYALSFRQVTEIGNGEGETNVSDLRSETWEDGKARSFRFSARNYLNQKLDRDTNGRAERSDDKVKVTVSKPASSSNVYDARTLFPTEHLRKIIEAARADKTLLEAPVYDGSEAGDKTYDTLTVIGRPSETPPADIETPAKTPELAKETYWPVTVSYFERGKAKTGEQEPDYQMSFDLYANGVSRALKIDYGEFVLDGELKELEFLKPTGCP